MAVPEQTPYIEHTGNGVTTSFALKFQCESKDHLIVLVDEIEPPIATWSLTGGNVVFTTAPAAGKKITAQRNTPFSRNADYQSYNNSFRPPAVNKDFDWIWWKLQELGVADWILGARIDALKNYVDRKDDELKAYLMEEIRKQGVALDQLDEYYNYLMERLAQIAVDKGWDASFVVDASGKNQQEINDEYARRFKTVADPRNFGSPNNGVSDDAQGVREAVAYLQSIGGGTLYMDSNVPWVFKTLSSNNTDAVLLGLSNIKIDFGSQLTKVEAKEEMRAMFKLSDIYQNNIDIFGGRIVGNRLAEYGLYGDPSTYNPFMQINGLDVRTCTKAAASMNPYMTNILRSNFGFAPKGLVLNNKSSLAEITSTTLIGVYANGCTEKGFEINDRMMYANLISCGADDCGGIAYDLAMQSANILGCGAERSVKLARFNMNDGVQVRGFVGVGIGSLDSANPSDAAVEVSGASFDAIEFSGVRLLTNPAQPRYRSKDLKVVSSSGKFPKVIVHDRSFLKQNTEISGVTSIYGNPVEFRESPLRISNNTAPETITPAELASKLSLYSNTHNDFNYVIQLSIGTENLDKILSDLRGNGKLTIQGNGADRTLVKIKGARHGLQLKDCNCHIVFRNLTIENQLDYGDLSLTQLDIENCRLVTLDNVLFSSPTYTIGQAVRSRRGSMVRCINGTITDNNHKEGDAWVEETGGRIEFDAMPDAPTSGRWSYGMRIKNSDPTTTGIIEWVYVRNISTSTNEWRAVTV